VKAQIANYTAAMGNLGIAALQAKLTDVLTSLQLAYNAYNSASTDLSNRNLSLIANLQSINNLTSQKV